jgi:hypothetical protein
VGLPVGVGFGLAVLGLCVALAMISPLSLIAVLGIAVGFGVVFPLLVFCFSPHARAHFKEKVEGTSSKSNGQANSNLTSPSVPAMIFNQPNVETLEENNGEQNSNNNTPVFNG